MSGGFLKMIGLIHLEIGCFRFKGMLEVFLREYLEELFKGYENYCNLTEIQEHLQKVINT